MRNHVPHLPSARQQRGIALIAVVMILILVSLIGVMSVRYSKLNQDLAKNAQAKKLLQQSSDVPLAFLSQNDTNNQLATFMNATGPLGYLRFQGKESAEYVLCYQPTVRKGLFAYGNHRIILDASRTTGNVDGYCKIDSTNKSFTSSRKVALTQVSITRPSRNQGNHDAVAIKPFEVVDSGTDNASIAKAPPVYYRTYSTSILPNMSRIANTRALNACLQKPMGGIADPDTVANMRKCLQAADVPATTQVQDFIYKAQIAEQ